MGDIFVEKVLTPMVITIAYFFLVFNEGLSETKEFKVTLGAVWDILICGMFGFTRFTDSRGGFDVLIWWSGSLVM